MVEKNLYKVMAWLEINIFSYDECIQMSYVS